MTLVSIISLKVLSKDLSAMSIGIWFMMIGLSGMYGLFWIESMGGASGIFWRGSGLDSGSTLVSVSLEEMVSASRATLV